MTKPYFYLGNESAISVCTHIFVHLQTCRSHGEKVVTRSQYPIIACFSLPLPAPNESHSQLAFSERSTDTLLSLFIRGRNAKTGLMLARGM